MSTVKIRIKKSPTESISNTLSEVPRYAANIEAERGETAVADFDQDGQLEHMNIGGKRHSEGGTPLNVPNGTFIFSDNAKMKLGGAVLEEFGKSANTSKKYTPAQLAKQYNLNKYKAILDDENSDPYKRRTAELMTENYNQKLGKLALVQEAKKGFPTGIPAIAMPLLGIDPTAAPQPEMAMGGVVKAAYGLEYDPWQGDRFQNKANKSKYKIAQIENLAGELGYTGPKDNLSFQKWILSKPEYRGIADDLHAKYGMPKSGKMADGKWGYRWDAIADNLPRPQAEVPFVAPEINDPFAAMAHPGYTAPAAPGAVATPASIKPGDVNRTASNQAPFDYMAPDKWSMAQAARERMGIKKYLPSYAAPEVFVPNATFYDPTRELAANSEQANTQNMYAAMFAGPQRQRAVGSSVQGQALGQAANTLAKYDSLNVGVANQVEAQRADAMSRQSVMNTEARNKTYEGNVIANQQFDNARIAADNNMLKSRINAWNNRSKLDMTNQTNQRYFIDPDTGRMVLKQGFDPSDLYGGAGAPGSAQSQGMGLENYKQLYNYALKMIGDDKKAQEWALEQLKGNKAKVTDKDYNGIPDHLSYNTYLPNLPLTSPYGR